MNIDEFMKSPNATVLLKANEQLLRLAPLDKKITFVYAIVGFENDGVGGNICYAGELAITGKQKTRILMQLMKDLHISWGRLDKLAKS